MFLVFELFSSEILILSQYWSFHNLSFVKIWFFEFCYLLSFLVLSQFWIFKFCYYLSFWVSSQFDFWVSSQFEFLSFITIWVLSLITIWVFQFHHNLCFSVSSTFEFLCFIMIWVFEFHHNLNFLSFFLWKLVFESIKKKEKSIWLEFSILFLVD